MNQKGTILKEKNENHYLKSYKIVFGSVETGIIKIYLSINLFSFLVLFFRVTNLYFHPPMNL